MMATSILKAQQLTEVIRQLESTLTVPQIKEVMRIVTENGDSRDIKLREYTEVSDFMYAITKGNCEFNRHKILGVELKMQEGNDYRDEDVDFFVYANQIVLGSYNNTRNDATEWTVAYYKPTSPLDAERAIISQYFS